MRSCGVLLRSVRVGERSGRARGAGDRRSIPVQFADILHNRGTQNDAKGLGGRYAVTRAAHHFNLGTQAERNLFWEKNTRFWEVANEGFQLAVETPTHTGQNTLPEDASRNDEIRYNSARDAEVRTRRHLFPESDRHFKVLDPEVSDRFIQLVRNRLSACTVSPTFFTEEELKEAAIQCNHELPLTLYSLKKLAERDPEVAKKMDERRFDCGIVSCDMIEGHQAAVVDVSCGSVRTMLGDSFLDLAKQISQTACSLEIEADFDIVEQLLTSELYNSDLSVSEALQQLSDKCGEKIGIRRVSLVPCPEDGLIGWHINNPRERHAGQGSAICMVLVLLNEADSGLLEPEWKFRLQETLPHPVAQHCLLEPLWYNAEGRMLKQPFLSPLPRHELMRFPSGRPSLFEWMEDQCARSRLLISRFGVVNVQLGLGSAKTWVSYAAEQYRYKKFSEAVDPAMYHDATEGNLDKNMSVNESDVLPDMQAEEMWHNEPGQRTFSQHEAEDNKNTPTGFETDDELMRAKD